MYSLRLTLLVQFGHDVAQILVQLGMRQIFVNKKMMNHFC